MNNTGLNLPGSFQITIYIKDTLLNTVLHLHGSYMTKTSLEYCCHIFPYPMSAFPLSAIDHFDGCANKTVFENTNTSLYSTVYIRLCESYANVIIGNPAHSKT